MRRIALMVSLIAICFFAAMAQRPGDGEQPVTWKFSVRMNGDKTGEVVMTAKIAKGWHLYGFTQPEGGPVPTTVDLSGSTGVVYTGSVVTNRRTIDKVDPALGMKVNYWENTVTFTRPFRVTDRTQARVRGAVRFMTCDGLTCLPPASKEINVAVPAKKK